MYHTLFGKICSLINQTFAQGCSTWPVPCTLFCSLQSSAEVPSPGISRNLTRCVQNMKIATELNIVHTFPYRRIMITYPGFELENQAPRALIFLFFFWDPQWHAYFVPKQCVNFIMPFFFFLSILAIIYILTKSTPTSSFVALSII